MSVVFSVALMILVMINGWGLQPKSWAWIIGAGVVGQVFVRLLLDVAKDDINRQE